MSWHELIKNPEHVLDLEPEELAGHMLEYLHQLDEGTRRQILTGLNFGNQIRHIAGEEVSAACMEAWSWLLREGLLISRPADMGAGRQISRRGMKLKNRIDVDAYRKSQLLLKSGLHTSLLTSAWPAFIRGDYPTAVFAAFKDVEVSVRNAARYGDTDIGVDLMRKAFHPDNGPLAQVTDPKAEREALAHLFAGAVGSYKNPHSHRHVAIDAQQAAEMITLASHLLRIVEARIRP